MAYSHDFYKGARNTLEVAQSIFLTPREKGRKPRDMDSGAGKPAAASSNPDSISRIR
jgi:hypothetical protein